MNDATPIVFEFGCMRCRHWKATAKKATGVCLNTNRSPEVPDGKNGHVFVGACVSILA